MTKWVIDNTTYVCDGCTSALNLLLRQVGNCQGRKGHIGGVCYEWTIAVLDSKVVNIDATTCESNFGRYFAVSDDNIAKTYVW